VILLFLCIGNSARSQMAEALARATAPAGWAIHSAGTEPKGIHPLAVRAMAERDLDLGAHRSKGLDAAPLDPDVVITLCGDAAERCPTFPRARRREHWELPDPAHAGEGEDALATFRAVRDDLERRIADFWRREG
jgi:arsenate reductase